MSRSTARSLATNNNSDVEFVPVYAPRWIRPDRVSSRDATTDSGEDGGETVMMTSPSSRSRPRRPVARIESFDGLGQENSSDGGEREPPAVPEREYRRPRPHSDNYAPSTMGSITTRYVSSSLQDSSWSIDDDPFTKRQRRQHGSVTLQRDRQWLSDESSSYSDEPFFSPSTTTIGYRSPRSVDPESWEGRNEDKHWADYHNMCIQPFHWTENIELGSPWVGRRTKEILNHVDGLIETQQEPETTSANDSGDSTMDQNKDAYEWCSESEDSITYEVANKICDAVIKHKNDDRENETVVSGGGQCASSERFKWTELYPKFLNYHQSV